MQNSKDLTLIPEGRRIRRTNLASSWKFLWLISCYTSDQCWPQKPHGTVKNSFRNRIDLKSNFFSGKNWGFVLKNTHERYVFCGKKWWLGQKVQKSLQLRKMFSAQNALVCLVGAAIQVPCMLGHLSPRGDHRGSCDRLLPSPPEMPLRHGSPLQLIKNNLGYIKKTPNLQNCFQETRQSYLE